MNKIRSIKKKNKQDFQIVYINNGYQLNVFLIRNNLRNLVPAYQKLRPYPYRRTNTIPNIYPTILKKKKNRIYFNFC